ncbi:hypothetical protein ACJX0J_036944, partial [Zea mays]
MRTNSGASEGFGKEQIFLITPKPAPWDCTEWRPLILMPMWFSTAKIWLSPREILVEKMDARANGIEPLFLALLDLTFSEKCQVFNEISLPIVSIVFLKLALFTIQVF